ncbi:MAG: hypothetical protein SFZ03_11115 [Candidatus Melainabacteria bacterium]|nr:hypothetical protein [Candidatus Melainabacteria bacterium]
MSGEETFESLFGLEPVGPFNGLASLSDSNAPSVGARFSFQEKAISGSAVIRQPGVVSSPVVPPQVGAVHSPYNLFRNV